MRIVHMVQYFQPGYTGGIQRYVAELAQCQQQAGHDVSIFTVELPDRISPAAERGTLPIIARRAWGAFLRTPLYPPFFGDMGPGAADVAHFHGPSPWFDLALLAARPRWRRTVLTIHNTFPDGSPLQRWFGHLGKALFRKTIDRADIVIAPHERFLAAMMGQPQMNAIAHKVRIVPPGVNHGRFRPLDLPRDPASVLFVAHIRPEKGLHVLIDAMRRLPHLRLDVLGSVSYEHGYYEAMRAHAHAALGDRVRFVIDPSPDTLVDAYSRAACVVVPSLGLESWNLVLLEAATCGAACVRTDLPGLAWADFALTAPANNAHELSITIEQAIAQRAELGASARYAATQFSWSRTHRESFAAYQSALGDA
jgi:glycosyltransferase involved in cell wall biosynthesis